MPEYKRRLPHFHPEDRYLFLTWRLWGSLPVKFASHGYQTPGHAFAEIDRVANRLTSGPLWLQDPRIASLVSHSVLIGAGERRFYDLRAWVVMPNRTRIIVAVGEGESRFGIFMAIFRMPPMKILIWLTILASSIFLAALVVVVNDFGGHNTNQRIRQSVSPDGRLVAEMRQVTTPMNGGPDTLQVTIKEVHSQSGDLIYSQVYGCSLDYSGYSLTWKTPAELVVTYGACDGGRWRSRAENKFLVRQSMWKDVKIDYHDSGYMAHGTR